MLRKLGKLGKLETRTLNSLNSLNSLQSDSDNEIKPPFVKGRFGGNVNMNGGVLHHHYIKSNKDLPDGRSL